MKLRKICIALLALLVAAMAIVPFVSADEEQKNPDAAKITTGSPDPSMDVVIREILDNASGREILPESIAAKADKDGYIPLTSLDAESGSYLNDYISPAQEVIRAMKTRNYSDAQISDLLEKSGYGWDPKTGACWKGTSPTQEEQKVIDQIRGTGYSPYRTSAQSRETPAKSWDGRAGGATQSVVNENVFVGFNGYMNPGSMIVRSTGTFQHVVTTHVGKKTPSGQDDWTEAGVSNSMNDPYARYFTYDNDEGGWQFHGAAEVEWFKNYAIYVTSTSDSSGYIYNIWINNNWVRSGHLNARQTGINNANEIWSLGSNWFSHDRVNPTFQYGSLYTTSGSVQWGDYVGTETSLNSDPHGYVLKDHYMSGGTWKFFSWNV